MPSNQQDERHRLVPPDPFGEDSESSHVDVLELDPKAVIAPQLDNLLKKISEDSGVSYDLRPANPFEPLEDQAFVDPALEALEFLGIDFEELTSRVIDGFDPRKVLDTASGVNPFLKQDFDFSLRGASLFSASDSIDSAVSFPADQYSYGHIPNSSKQLHDWFAVPLGNATLLYDSEILSFRDSGVAVSLAIGAQNVFPLAGFLTAGAAAVSLWHDMKVLSQGRTGIEKTKYALGAVADTAIIAGGIGAALKTVSPETRIGLVSCGYVGRLMVELIPSMVKFEKKED